VPYRGCEESVMVLAARGLRNSASSGGISIVPSHPGGINAGHSDLFRGLRCSGGFWLVCSRPGGPAVLGGPKINVIPFGRNVHRKDLFFTAKDTHGYQRPGS